MPTTSLQQDDEIIPGYRLLERLGSGGYGEVWKATAPGGLLKAIKIVFGRVEEMRGEREMKALERIKELRHPFVISLERVEIVEGQLLFVTELAERSLKDLFDEYRKDGKAGIPRKELLGYLHDAADALDYMREKLQLQHLDVKPENLLLAGNHAKVADFGLVKRLEDVSVSMMGGLTPLYASPESFDGTPSLFSDQYSLAIVYQEMLTGILPFSGATISKLAAQHLSGTPNLSPLLEHDRVVLRKALCKEPTKRFPSCRNMVEALTETRNDAAKVRRERLESILERPAGADDAMQAPSGDGDTQSGHRATSVTFATPHDETGDPPHPTLWIGLGGLAVQTLRRLKRQAEGGVAGCDIFLAIDSDGSSALGGAMADGEAALDRGEFLALPLQRSQDYQELPAETLRNVNRRWIYNLPRSQRVEGLRPLGQLIFLGGRKVIRQALTDKAEALRNAVERFRDAGARGKIVVLAGVNGGTGSGMVVETLKELAGLRFALKDIDIVATLLSTGGRTATQRELGAANAIATLDELEAFVASQVTGSRLAPNIFVLSCKPDASEQELRDWLSDVAEGLQIQRRFASSDCLEELRSRASDEGSEGRLRSFSTISLDRVSNARVREWTSMLCRLAAEDWLGSPLRRGTTKSPTNASSMFAPSGRPSGGIDEKRFDDVVVEVSRKLGLTTEGASARMDGVFRNAAGRTPIAGAEELAATYLGRLLEGENVADLAKQAWERRELGWAEGGSIAQAVEKTCESWIGGARAKFVEWLRGVADKPGVGVVGSLRLLTRFAERLDALRQEVQTRIAGRDGVATGAVAELEIVRRQAIRAPGSAPWKSNGKPDDAVKALAVAALAATWDRETARAIDEAIHRAAMDLRKRREHLQHMQRELNIVAESFSSEYESLRTDGNSSPSGADSVDDFVHRRILARIPDFLREVNRLVLPDVDHRGSLGPWLEPGKALSVDLCDSLRISATRVIENGVAEFRRNPGECLDEWKPTLEAKLPDVIRSATPPWYRVGSSALYLLRSGSPSLQRIFEPALSSVLAAKPATVADVERESVLYGEIDGLEFAHIRDSLSKDRPDLIEIAERLQLWRNGT